MWREVLLQKREDIFPSLASNEYRRYSNCFDEDNTHRRYLPYCWWTFINKLATMHIWPSQDNQRRYEQLASHIQFDASKFPHIHLTTRLVPLVHFLFIINMPSRRVQPSTVEQQATVEARQEAQELQGQVDAATQRAIDSRADNQPPTTKKAYSRPQAMWKVSPLMASSGTAGRT